MTGYPSGYPYRTLFVWVALWASIWLALVSPWSPGWNTLLAALVVFLLIVALGIATKRVRIRRHATRHVLSAVDTALGSLPTDVRRNTPLVLVIGNTGDELADAFGADLVRITDAAIWVRNDDAGQLMHLADALKRWRDGQGPDAIAYLLAADQAIGAVTLQAALKRWRSAIHEASRAVGYPLPVCVALYTRHVDATPDECPWFGLSGTATLQRPGSLATLVATRLARYIHVAIPDERKLRAYRAARLDALTRWASEAILPALVDTQRGAPPLQLAAFGATEIEGRPVADSLYGQFVAGITELSLVRAQDAAMSALRQAQTRPSCPLPEPLLPGIAPQPVRRALPRALAHAFVWTAACFCAAAAASAWQNRALVERVAGDMARYRAIAPAQDTARVDALKAVKHDRDELERYAASGVPPRLGLGFYRGAPLLPVARALIAGYQPPSAPPPTIELDSMSLFRSGSAVLNPGSNRVLIGALEMIKAHPDKRVLVAGHTDSVGDPASNLKLSGARAASVRDWLADASGIAPTHFAIQGYGDTRPNASNDTEAGRAANRRVEITLVPDCRNTREVGLNSNDNDHDSGSNTDTNGSSPQGQSACSFE